MKKKLLAVVMSMVFVTGMLAGCGSSTKETSTKTQRVQKQKAKIPIPSEFPSLQSMAH